MKDLSIQVGLPPPQASVFDDLKVKTLFNIHAIKCRIKKNIFVAMIESNNDYDTSAAVLYWIDFNNIIQRRITNDLRHVKSPSHVGF